MLHQAEIYRHTMSMTSLVGHKLNISETYLSKEQHLALVSS